MSAPTTKAQSPKNSSKRSIGVILFWLAFSLLILVVAAAGGAFWYVDKLASEPLKSTTESFIIQKGDSLHKVNNNMLIDNIVSNKWILRAIYRVKGEKSHIKAGEYRFEKGMNLYQVLDDILAGKVVQRSVTLVDGHTFKEFRQSLSQAPKLDITLDGLSDADIMSKIGPEQTHPEGLFFPATYDYQSGMTDLDVLKRAYEKMQIVLQEQWKQRVPDPNLKTPYDALILASIVEKETGKPEERPLIAGVFLNRLRKGMLLQTDPTVIYGMGDKYDGNIRAKDLRTDTPYNTYTRAGLPPTPIANPGLAAIHAVLHPDTTKALYFVATGDGGHVFSNTLTQHNKAVRQYQLGGR